MKLKFTTYLCKANPCKHVVTKRGTLFYYWSSFTHIAPIRFFYNKSTSPSLIYQAVSVLILRKWRIDFKLKAT